LKDEGAVSLDEQEATGLHDSTERFSNKSGVFSEVLTGDRRFSRWPRVVAGVREAREPFEKDLKLEQVLDFSLDGQLREPGFSGVRMLSHQAARVAQQIVVRVTFVPHRALEPHGHCAENVTVPGHTRTQASGQKDPVA